MLTETHHGAWAILGLVACVLGSFSIYKHYDGGAVFRAWLLAGSYSLIGRWLAEQ